MREKLVEIVSASVRTVSVLARPGTPSRSTCPPVSRLMSNRSIMYACPTTRSATWLLTSWIRRASALDEACVATGLPRRSVKSDVCYKKSTAWPGRSAADRRPCIDDRARPSVIRLQLVEGGLLGLCERAHLSGRQIAQLHGPELDTDQSIHFEAEGLTETTHLAVSSLAEGDR